MLKRVKTNNRDHGGNQDFFQHPPQFKILMVSPLRNLSKEKLISFHYVLPPLKTMNQLFFGVTIYSRAYHIKAGTLEQRCMDFVTTSKR